MRPVALAKGDRRDDVCWFPAIAGTHANPAFTPRDRRFSLEVPRPYRLNFRLSSAFSRNQSAGKLNGFFWQFVALFYDFPAKISLRDRI